MWPMLNNFPVPENNSGRGVHFPAETQPKGLLENWDSYWKDHIVDMGIQWAKLMDAGDGSMFEMASKLYEIGIHCVIRFYREKPNPGMIYADREVLTAKRYVEDLGCVWFETNNEPDLDLEWKDGKRPPNWLDIVVDNFIAEADMIRNVGGYLLFPAFGVGKRANPFQMIVDRGRRDLLNGNMALAIHNYCLARPLDYPEDEVTRFGKPITEKEWKAEASDKKIIQGKPDGPTWAWEMSWETVNEHRKRLANPEANIMEDSTCFRAFEYFNALVNEACGHSIPIFTTEGGYNVGQRAGDTGGDDPRWPKPSPQKTAQLLLDMYRAVEEAPDYYFACMPWLLSNNWSGHGGNWEHQGPWFTGAYKYEWNARNLASGVYLYRLKAEGYVETRKMILMR